MVDVVVIGGGPAGLSAALSAKRHGAKSVLIIERDKELGGILQQCIHPGFGLHTFGEELTGPEFAQRYINMCEREGVDALLDTMALEIKGDGVWVTNTKGVRFIKAKSIVLAMGCRERPRGAIRIPGTRPAGIFTAGTAQRLINIEGYMPGKKVVILGSGDVGLIMARRMTLEGAKVLGVFEIMPYPGGLTRNIVQCLNDFGIPLYLSHSVVEIYGRERIEGVKVAPFEGGRPVLSKAWKIECDTLLLSVGLIPENELSRAAGVEIDPKTGGPVVSDRMETNLPGVFSCGNVTVVYDLVDYVAAEAERAGKYAALWARGKIGPAKRKVRVKPGKGVRFVVPQFMEGEGKGRFYLRVVKPMRPAVLRVEPEILRKKLIYARPGEMISFEVDPKRVGGVGEIEVIVEEGER